MYKELLFGGAEIDSDKANLGLAILRVIAGLSMAFGHGIGKIPPSPGLVAGTAKLGFPLPEFFAWAAAFGEFGGGLMLALGLLTRPGTALMGFTMMVAAFGVHAADPFGRKEMALLYLAVAVMFLLVGSGKYGVDACIRSRLNRS
ncbi:MAG: DoxX family protein [Candidatus Latescibacteria bacterium]|nr:DoxX family protein [Candidatus Latescibacterota bacterium]